MEHLWIVWFLNIVGPVYGCLYDKSPTISGSRLGPLICRNSHLGHHGKDAGNSRRSDSRGSGPYWTRVISASSSGEPRCSARRANLLSSTATLCRFLKYPTHRSHLFGLRSLIKWIIFGHPFLKLKEGLRVN